MTMYDIISSKRDGKELTKSQIGFWITGVVNDTIPDYQSAALLMAIYLNGMSKSETAELTRCMAYSGDIADLSVLGDNTVDKHSSGGVGDKTTFIAAPIAAAAEAVVAKMSGRGLGHTGGTVDKLESIPGIKTALSTEEFFNIAKRNNLVLAGQSGNLAPADKKLYALRDVIATVDCIPLIASSIMSKKIAGGSKSIVLDIKVGNGAFMKNIEQAEALANAMIDIGKACDRRVTAVLSNMNIPLGNNIGNALEVIEAAELLKEPKPCDLIEISLILAAEMIALSLNISIDDAKTKAEQALYSKAAFECLCNVITAQGGDSNCLKDISLFKKASAHIEVIAPDDGYITSMDTEKIGMCAVHLGAGRLTKETVIDYTAGIKLHKKTGDRVTAGESIATLYAKNDEICANVKNEYLKAISIGVEPIKTPMVYKIIR